MTSAQNKEQARRDGNMDCMAEELAQHVSGVARKWVDGEISTGKLLQLAGVPRPAGDDLIGGLWHAYRDKVEALHADLKHEAERCEKALAEAKENDWEDSVIAETSRRRVLLECAAKLQLHLGCCFTTDHRSNL